MMSWRNCWKILAADSIVLATAREYKAKIMTSNEHFRDLVGE
jgi:predicted nucleic acid-binding protein